MSVVQLPEPRSWRRGGRWFIWASLGLFAGSSLTIFWCVLAAIRGNYLTPVAVLGWLIFMPAVYAAMIRVSFGWSALRASYDSTSTTIRPDWWFSALCFGGLAASIPCGVLLIISLLRGAIDIPISRGMQIFSPVLVAYGVVVSIAGLIVAWRRGGMGYLQMSSTTIEIANVAVTKVVDWDDVTDVKAFAETKRSRKAIVLCLTDGSEEIIGSVDIYVPHGAALYWMVRHYWRRPDDRVELTDERALDRLREGRFDLE